MSTLPSSLNPKSLSFYSVQNLAVPCEGPRAIPLILDFSLNPSYSLGLQNTQALQLVSQIQAIFVDNSASNSAIVILCPISGQKVSIGGGKQAYVNLLCPNPAQLIFSSGGGVAVQVELLNFPVTNCVWSAT